MNQSMPFEFTINKANNTVNVKRSFAANLDRVWDAWTNPEILDQWWAPKPYKTVTKSMDFRVGGTWLYAMVSPEGQEHWCKNDYKHIEPKTTYTGLDAFCDEHGTINTDMPRTAWTNVFSAGEGYTQVTITAVYASLADLEKVIALGFKEGFTMAMGNLDAYLAEPVV